MAKSRVIREAIETLEGMEERIGDIRDEDTRDCVRAIHNTFLKLLKEG